MTIQFMKVFDKMYDKRQTPFLKMLEIHNTGIKHKIIFYDEEKKPK